MAFAFDTIIDNKFFDDYIWIKFFDLVIIKRYKYIIIDISKIKMIKAEVLPKLSCLGLIAQKNGTQIEINLNPASKVKDFLGSIGFLDIVHKRKIFVLNDGQIGDKHQNSNITKAFLCFDQNLADKYDQKYSFNPNMSQNEKLKHCIAAEIIGERYLINPGEITREMIRKSPVLSVLNNVCHNKLDANRNLMQFALDFVELIHNAVWHGMTPGFFSVQAGTYNKGEFGRVDICISDCGIGLYETLSQKDWKKEQKKTHTISLEKFLSLTSEKEKNIHSVLEMIYFRSDDNDRGIYDIMKNLIDKKNLRINITNGCTQLYLTNKYHGTTGTGFKAWMFNNHPINIYIYDKKPISYGFSMDISFDI